MARVVIKSEMVQPRVLHILAGISNVAHNLSIPDEVVITSGCDSTHSRRSLHYALRAIDVRSKNFPNAISKQAFIKALKEELGPEYDVIIESEGRDSEHFHIEWDPKGP